MAHKILLVDDEPDFLSVIRMRLSKSGYDVVCAHHGKDALDKLKLKRPDVIISDVMMPVMDGVDLYQEIKKNPETKNIPVIIITVKDKLEKSFSAVGADAFIAKGPMKLMAGLIFDVIDQYRNKKREVKR